jgi:putative resolvase
MLITNGNTMKLSEYAKLVGISYKTAYRWYKMGNLNGFQMPTGTIIVLPQAGPKQLQVAIYARVSSTENKSDLDRQAERLVTYCVAKGYAIHSIIKEVGSGVNDQRPKLLALLRNQSVNLIIVEHKDRLTRFGFAYIETLLSVQDRHIEVINAPEAGREDLIADLTAIVYSFCARLYGLRRAKRNTEKITAGLQLHEDM